MKTLKLALPLVCLALLLSGCASKADLVVTALETTGSPTVDARGRHVVPVRVIVANQGVLDAPVFKVSIEYSGPDGTSGVAFTVPGETDTWYPYTDAPLAAGDKVTLEGTATLQTPLTGITATLTATADSCVGDTSMPAHCRVLEDLETNNDSTPLSVALP